MYVETLRRYPVKSMLGEEIAESDVTERGLAGDRARAVLDVATGKVASAKNPRLWRRLLEIEGVRVPGDAELSALLGREVRVIDEPFEGAAVERSVPERVLAEGIEAEVPHTITTLGGASPTGTFFDFAPLHLITTSTIDRIGALSPRGHVEALRYRPNLVIATEQEGFVENDWVGRELRIGADVVLHVIVASPRCAIPTLAHGPLARDVDALRTVARHNRVRPFDMEAPQACAGVYARVVRPGRVRNGDPVRFE